MTEVRYFSGEDTLPSDEILSGLALPVKALYAGLPES